METKASLTQKIADTDDAEMSLVPDFPQKRFSIELTNICNHTCLFCPHNGKITRKKGIINEQFFKRILDEAYALGSREVCISANGEAFMVKNLAAYVKAAKNAGGGGYSYVFLTSNGALATPDRMKEVMDAGLDSIRFSINAGSRETYKFIHGKDDFETVRENLLWSLKYRKENKIKMNIFISFVVNKYNISEIDMFKEQFSGLVDEIVFMRVRNIGGYMPEIKEMTNEGVKETSAMHDRCVFPFNGVVVTWEGYLTACCFDWQNYLAVADLNKTGLKDAWYSEKMKGLRRRFMEDSYEGTICQLCKNRTYSKPYPLVEELSCEYKFE